MKRNKIVICAFFGVSGTYMGPMGQKRLMRLIGLMGDRTGETDTTLILNRVKGLVITNETKKQE